MLFLSNCKCGNKENFISIQSNSEDVVAYKCLDCGMVAIVSFQKGVKTVDKFKRSSKASV